MNHQKLLSICRQIQSCPTAPYHEYYVRNEIRSLLSALPHVSTYSDGFGNLIATYQRGEKAPRLAFGAHMDHPGWVRSPLTQQWEFLGGVPQVYLDQNPPRREFGDFAMFHLPEFEINGRHLVSRVCDDLVGCAGLVALLEELERQQIEATCYGIFTRAEEVGFAGAMHLARNWPFSPEVRFVSLETSAPVTGVEMGKGPVVRAGDRLSIFDPDVSGDLIYAAELETLPVQRALLDRGACEATAMQFYGLPSAGISILLGNYHNCGPNLSIEPEYVNIDDLDGMVDLLVALVKHAGAQSPSRHAMRERFEKRVAQHEIFERATASRFV